LKLTNCARLGLSAGRFDSPQAEYAARALKSCEAVAVATIYNHGWSFPPVIRLLFSAGASIQH
jgi:hypothetical protein